MKDFDTIEDEIEYRTGEKAFWEAPMSDDILKVRAAVGLRKDADLLPCPFCGGEASRHLPTCRPETPYNPTDRLYPTVMCCSCHAEVPGANGDYRGDTATTAWNARQGKSDENAESPRHDHKENT